MSLPPSQIIIRPPVEAYSILIPVTGGCSWNQCRFCGVYKGVQKYTIRPLDEVIRDIDLYADSYPDHKWVFLAGGNPTSAPTDYLVKILTHVKARFKSLERLSTYSKALDIVRKTDAELMQLKESGLDIVYMGLESGSNTVLRLMKKGTNDRTIITVGRRLLKVGIRLSLYVILGLGSYEHSDEHVRETARVLTEINPTIFRFRTLNVIPTAPLWQDVQNGKFTVMRPVDILKEERDILMQLGSNVTSEMYNDHVSNYCTFSSKNVSLDREQLIAQLNRLIENPKIQQMEPKWLLHM
ncbi:MAG: radical SAM protein [Candidatus Lokiarchaeota archaeon]|nr:radical SAM protein [Candidatus Lokiarchaeota archaeon]